ncbi:alpha/beta-hydrolase [Sparassis latifolia]
MGYAPDDEQALLGIASATATRRRRNGWRSTIYLSLFLLGVHRRQFHEAASLQNADPEFDWYSLTPASDIHWTPCFVEYQCARLVLPLDYLSPAGFGPNVTIALQMLPATDKANYKGTILLNPGGPGGSGTSLVARAGKNLSQIVGPAYDVLGFDPRGTGASTPVAQCFASEAEYQIWNLQGGGLLHPDGVSVPLARAREQVVGQRCAQALGGSGIEDAAGSLKEWGGGRFMSTPSVATDMLRITEKLGQEKLQYWGFSYGSVLGQYFAAMYPDKVGRLIIDGVMDGYNYRGDVPGEVWNSNLVDTEKVRTSFFTFCHQAGPEKCPLYEPTVEEIIARVDVIMERISAEPVALPFASGGPTVIGTTELIRAMFLATYNPAALFGSLADTYVAVEQNDTTTLAKLWATVNGGFACSCKSTPAWLADSETEAFYFIACADREPTSYAPDDFAAHLANLTAVSPSAGPIWGQIYLQCTEWSVRSKWRYTGPLAAESTANPVLLIAPRYDPVCPLSDGRKVHARYGGSGLLVQNSFGHCTLSAPSLCTAKYVREYFATGALPPEGAECEPDELPFVGTVKDVAAMSNEDRELLDALRGLSGELLMMGNF